MQWHFKSTIKQYSQLKNLHSFKSKEKNPSKVKKKKTFHTVKTKKIHPSRPILREITKGRIEIILHRNLEMQEGTKSKYKYIWINFDYKTNSNVSLNIIYTYTKYI